MSEAIENATVNAPAEKAEETKAEKFIRLGEYRINKAIDAIGRLENLANKSAYEYTPEQVEAMFAVLEPQVAEVKVKFTVTQIPMRMSNIAGCSATIILCRIWSHGEFGKSQGFC